MRFELKIKDPSIVDQLYQHHLIHRAADHRLKKHDDEGRISFLHKVPCSLLRRHNNGKKQGATVKYASLARNDLTGSTWLRTSERGDTNPQYFFMGFYDDLMKSHFTEDDFKYRFNRLLFLALQPGNKIPKRVSHLLQRLANNELKFKTEQATIDSIHWSRFIRKYPNITQKVFDRCDELTVSDQDVFSFLDALARTAQNPPQIRAALNWLDTFITSSNENYGLQLQAEQAIRPAGADLSDKFSEEQLRESNQSIIKEMVSKQ